MTAHNPPLVVHVIYSLNTGGLENGLVNIVNRTPTDCYRHVIICITEAGDFARRITHEDIRVIELRKRAGHDFRFYRRFWRLIRQLRPDIVHSRNLAALETQLLTIGCPGLKRVHGEHGREVGDLDGTNWKYLAFRKVMRAFIHRYIAVSKDLENWLIGVVMIEPGKVRQIYNGVDRNRFSPQSVKPTTILPPPWRDLTDILVVGTVGRLTPVKDQHSLLRAVARLRDLSPVLFQTVRVLVVGDGPLRRQLEDLAVELQIDQITCFTGDRDDVPAMLAAMDIFVLSSLAEGISNTILEAMATGLPVIATEVGGNCELVEAGFNGSLVPVGDHAALAQALVLMLEDKPKRLRLGLNARQRVSKRFDWNLTVEAYLGVYDELLGMSAENKLERVG